MNADDRRPPMRILQVISKSEYGGAQTQVALLVDGLSAAGHTVAVVSSTGGPLLDAAEQSGAHTEIIGGLASSHPKDIARSIRSVRRVIEEWKPDVVHCHSSHAGLTVRIAAAWTSTPCVFTAHGLPFKRGVPVGRRIATWCAEFALARLPAITICVNSYEMALARRWLRSPQRRLRVIPTAVPDRPAPVRSGAPEGRLVVCAVCRLAPPKRVDILIRALGSFSQRATLTVVGSGPLANDLYALASAEGVAVEFQGDRDDVADILNAADLFAICSDHEGAPVSVLEAMRAALPVVASDLPGLREQLGSAGIYASNDPMSFARAIDGLVNSADARARLGADARRRYSERFTGETMLASTLDAYDAVIDGW